MRNAASPPGQRLLLLSAGVVAIDLATKSWVSASMQLGDSREILPFFNLVLMHNTGAAFSFLAGAGGWQRWFFTAITIVISGVLVLMLRRQHQDRLMATACALVLGGALGNLYDRLTLGYVVDFVMLHAGGYAWPAFNVADSAISAGVVLMVWDSLRSGADAGVAPREEKP